MSDHIIPSLIWGFKVLRSEALQLPASPLHPNPTDPHSPPVPLESLITYNVVIDVAITQIYVDWEPSGCSSPFCTHAHAHTKDTYSGQIDD